jgi:hypothetical protein
VGITNSLSSKKFSYDKKTITSSIAILNSPESFFITLMALYHYHQTKALPWMTIFIFIYTIKINTITKLTPS